MAIDADPTELDSTGEDDHDIVADFAGRDNAPTRTTRAALLAAALAVTALVALTGVLGWQARGAITAQTQRNQFISAARQGALNLTTISYLDADTDVRRILDYATGPFFDDLKNRSGPFIGVVKQAKAQTVGTITDAALQSVDGAPLRC